MIVVLENRSHPPIRGLQRAVSQLSAIGQDSRTGATEVIKVVATCGAAAKSASFRLKRHQAAGVTSDHKVHTRATDGLNRLRSGRPSSTQEVRRGGHSTLFLIATCGSMMTPSSRRVL